MVLPPSEAPVVDHGLDPLQVRLYQDWHIEVPVMRWPSPKVRLLRVSPQAYNSLQQYELLARAVQQAG